MSHHMSAKRLSLYIKVAEDARLEDRFSRWSKIASVKICLSVQKISLEIRSCAEIVHNSSSGLSMRYVSRSLWVPCSYEE